MQTQLYTPYCLYIYMFYIECAQELIIICYTPPHPPYDNYPCFKTNFIDVVSRFRYSLNNIYANGIFLLLFSNDKRSNFLNDKTRWKYSKNCYQIINRINNLPELFLITNWQTI